MLPNGVRNRVVDRSYNHRRIQELHWGWGKSSVERARVGHRVSRRRRRRRGRVWGGGVPSPQIFLHFHVEIAHLGGILAVNFKFYSMNKTVSEYDAIKRDKQYKIGYHQ